MTVALCRSLCTPLSEVGALRVDRAVDLLTAIESMQRQALDQAGLKAPDAGRQATYTGRLSQLSRRFLPAGPPKRRAR